MAAPLTACRNPSAEEIEEIDLSFIFLSPAITKGSEFTAGDRYRDPAQVRVIDGIDFGAERDRAIENAERFIREKRVLDAAGTTVYDKIFTIMSHARYRAGTLAQTCFEENKELFWHTISSRIIAEEPIQYVLPSFPFKLPNPAKTSRRTPDMGELLCLRRLYEICHAVSLVYPPGAQIVIASDGEIYRSIFAVSEHEAAVYSQAVQAMINAMGCADRILYTDIAALIADRQTEFDHAREAVRPVLARWWKDNPEHLRRLSLVQNMIANMNSHGPVTQDLVQLATRDLLGGVDGDSDELLINLRRVRSRIAARAEQAAFDFALLLYTLKETDIIRSSYPDAVRATVHPKPGQWGVNLVSEHGKIFPWAGVAFDKGGGDWRIRYESAVQRSDSGARPVHLADDPFPFFYENDD